MKKQKEINQIQTEYSPPNERQIEVLNAAIKNVIADFKPPENVTLSEWADKYRYLSAESSAEVGPWRTERTPYLKKPMDSFTDPNIKEIVVMASSQLGKSELLLNAIGYIIDQKPASILFIQPTIPDAQKFSRQRITPMIRDTPKLSGKFDEKKEKQPKKTGKSTNTVLQKTFRGGILTMAGSNAPSALASIPSRYVIGDEVDRWTYSAGKEGDPWTVATARQVTFYNRKSIRVSSPTIKGASKIEEAFYKGTQEVWSHCCPECGVFNQIVFGDIQFDYEKTTAKGGKSTYLVKNVRWKCPECGAEFPQNIMRLAPQEWIEYNPEAYQTGIRSFKINSLSSPWQSWADICKKFLEAKDEPEMLKAFVNTILGESFEDREKVEDPEILYNRRETYEAELPEGVLVLTCGVDTQDNRLEYEVVGYGRYGENWGIEKGFIMGRPDTEEVWEKLDNIIDKAYSFVNGKKLKLSLTFVDSGGHYTQEVYEQCYKRRLKNVFAIKGKGGADIPFTAPPSKIYIGQTKSNKANNRRFVYLYTIGVDSGKQQIMDRLKVQEAGPKYCHFPRNEEKGYDMNYFEGILSENLILKTDKSGRKKWQWEKVTSARNEALDCRDYANAAFATLHPNLDKIENYLKGIQPPAINTAPAKPRKRKNRFLEEF